MHCVKGWILQVKCYWATIAYSAFKKYGLSNTRLRPRDGEKEAKVRFGTVGFLSAWPRGQDERAKDPLSTGYSFADAESVVLE